MQLAPRRARRNLVLVPASFALALGLLVAALLSALVAGPFGTPAAAAEPGEVAAVTVQPGQIHFAPVSGYGERTLTVSGNGLVFSETFAAGVDPVLAPVDDYGKPLLDGSYTYELVLAPVVDPGDEKLLDQIRGDERALWELERDGLLPRGAVRSGYFQVVGGQFVFDPTATETTSSTASSSFHEANAPGNVGLQPAPPRRLDLVQIIGEDLVVKGSQCLGNDCLNAEVFDSDTLRLKENNTRIHFDDTSSETSTFPKNDWRLIANDQHNGGRDKFSLEDSTAGRELVIVEAAGRENALYVDSSGHIGFGTSNPALELHIVDGNTPGVRLDQNSSQSFTPQVWDIAGNEDNFFIRDVTHGGLLPLRIEEGTPTDTFFLDNSGSVAINHLRPDAQLHLRRDDGTAKLLVEEANLNPAGRTLLELVNHGNVQFMLRDTDTGDQWQFSALTASDLFQISKVGADQGKFRVRGGGGLVALVGNANIFDLDATGDLTIAGTLTESSDRDAKENFIPLDRREVLEKVLALPITTWNYKDNHPSVRHLGPVAQDFHAAFGLGATDTGIASLDAAGVALVAIQGAVEHLETRHREELEERDAEIDTLRGEIEELRRLVEALGER